MQPSWMTRRYAFLCVRIFFSSERGEVQQNQGKTMARIAGPRGVVREPEPTTAV